MKTQIKKLTAMGYDTAIKTWANEFEQKGYFLMAWKPGQVKETTVTTYNPSPTEGLKALLDMIRAKEKPPC